jgi:biopolymer transport protein ExbB/biopolymer transport protein TolQ
MLIEQLKKVALLGSEWVLYLLLALSIVSFGTMLERYFYFRKRRADLGELRKELLNRLNADDVAGAEKYLESHRAIEARIAREALRWAPGGPEALNDAVDSEIARVRKELENGSNFLGTLGNNAPFVGLFGTVLGVIIAFHHLGEAGQNSSAMGNVMAGIAEALVATGVGLFVALPAVVAYNLIQKRIGDIESGAVSLSKLISAYIKANPSVIERHAIATDTGAREQLASGPDSDDSKSEAAAEVA